MKKLIFLVLALLCFAEYSIAQIGDIKKKETEVKRDSKYDAYDDFGVKGSRMHNIGLDLVHWYATEFDISYNRTLSVIPPITYGFEIGISDDISIQPQIGIGFYQYDYTVLLLGARSRYYFFIQDNFEAYGAAFLGVNFPSDNYMVSSRLVYDLDIGARYRFNDKIGAFAELGLGASFVTIGVTIFQQKK